MSFDFYKTINDLTGGGLDSAKAAKDSLGAANEAYHLQQAIKEHGEPNVHRKAAELLLEKNKDSGMTYSEAGAEVSVRIKATLEATQGEKLFKETRKKLNGGDVPEPSFRLREE